jgi:exosome complex RNA-binding protein Rrp42 (RNase PH superfamily)
LEQLLVSGNHIDLKSLCLIPKRQCWTLFIDAMVCKAWALNQIFSFSSLAENSQC